MVLRVEGSGFSLFRFEGLGFGVFRVKDLEFRLEDSVAQAFGTLKL